MTLIVIPFEWVCFTWHKVHAYIQYIWVSQYTYCTQISKNLHSLHARLQRPEAHFEKDDTKAVQIHFLRVPDPAERGS